MARESEPKCEETSSFAATQAQFEMSIYMEERRPYWELKNVFGSIYSVIQMILRKFADNAWKPLGDAMNFNLMDTSDGDPRTSYTDDRRKIDVGWFYGLLELHYGRPGVDGSLVTCAQWQKFVGINNALARLFTTIKQYKRMRKQMPNPNSYYSVSFREPIPCIGATKYYAALKKCIDFHPADNDYGKYPYFS